jgi:hypothetical protein
MTTLNDSCEFCGAGPGQTCTPTCPAGGSSDSALSEADSIQSWLCPDCNQISMLTEGDEVPCLQHGTVFCERCPVPEPGPYRRHEKLRDCERQFEMVVDRAEEFRKAHEEPAQGTS